MVVRSALHTEEMLVGRLDDRVELDADARLSAQRVLEQLLTATDGDPIVASAPTKPFLDRQFDVRALSSESEARRVWRVIGLVDAYHHSGPFVARTR